MFLFCICRDKEENIISQNELYYQNLWLNEYFKKECYGQKITIDQNDIESWTYEFKDILSKNPLVKTIEVHYYDENSHKPFILMYPYRQHNILWIGNEYDPAWTSFNKVQYEYKFNSEEYEEIRRLYPYFWNMMTEQQFDGWIDEDRYKD